MSVARCTTCGAPLEAAGGTCAACGFENAPPAGTRADLSGQPAGSLDETIERAYRISDHVALYVLVAWIVIPCLLFGYWLLD